MKLVARGLSKGEEMSFRMTSAWDAQQQFQYRLKIQRRLKKNLWVRAGSLSAEIQNRVV